MKEQVKRIRIIDEIKGVLIILVLVGHFLQYTITNFDDCILFKAIYSFHMPLFFAMSGVNFAMSKRKCDRTHILFEKMYVFAKKLLYPWMVWTTIYFLLNFRSYDNYHEAIKLFVGGSSMLWFLPMLALITIGAYISVIISRTCFGRCALAGLTEDIVVFVTILILSYFDVIAFWYGISFWFGCLIIRLLEISSKFFERCKQTTLKLRWPLWCISLILIMIGANFWVRNAPPLFVDQNQSGIIKQILKSAYDLIMLVLGAVCVIGCCLITGKTLSNLFSWFGVHTLEIYVLSSFLFTFVSDYTNGYSMIVRGLSMLVVVFFSIIIVRLCDQKHGIRKVLFMR